MNIRDTFELFMATEFYHAVVASSQMNEAREINLLIYSSHYIVGIGEEDENALFTSFIPKLNNDEWLRLRQIARFSTCISDLNLYVAKSEGIFNRVERELREQFNNSLNQF